MAMMNSQKRGAVAFILIFSGLLSCADGATDSTAVSPPSVISAVGARTFLLEQGQSSGYAYYDVGWGGSSNLANTHGTCPNGYSPQLNLIPMSTTWSSYDMRAFHALGNLTTAGTGTSAYYQVNITAVSADMSGTGNQNIFLAWQVMCNSTAP